jgi:hypothetical protein
MTPEEVKEAIRQHKAGQGERTLEVPEWGLVGENCIHVPPMSVSVRSKFFDRYNKSQYDGIVFLVAEMSLDEKGGKLFSAPTLRNEADPLIIEDIFAFISEPFLSRRAAEADTEE